MASVETMKTRDRKFYKFSGAEIQTHPTLGTSTSSKVFSIDGRQVTVSTGNPYHLIGRTDRDVGSRFFTRDQFLTVDGVELNPSGDYNNSLRIYSLDQTVGLFRRRYVGPRLVLHPGSVFADFPMPPSFSTTALNALGTTAISRTIPTRTDANLAVFLGELREGLPKLVGSQLWRTRIKDFRALGGEYLNYKFGWESLVRDITGVFQAISDGDKILDQLERDSGKNVRRAYHFTPVLEREVTNVSTNQGLYPSLSSTLNPANGTRTTHRVTETKTWFEGCYTYYMSPRTRDRVANVAKYANNLLSLELTPEVLWELTPWSWVADYFGNIGDVMTNVTAFSQDSLLLRYGYVMQDRKVGYEYTWSGTIPGYGPTTTSLFAGNRTKQRLKATPYGFGLDTGGLTTSQWAILVALGIARAPQLL
jgi:hypothetical protein